MLVLVASLPFVPFKHLCTCHPRSALYRQHTYSSFARRHCRVQDTHAAPAHAPAAPQARFTPATQSAAATAQPTEQHRASHAQASQQQQPAAASKPGHASNADQATTSAAGPAPVQPQEVLNPMNYPGTSNKARRKALVQYLATIPEKDMTPEMLRRWRISKANRGKTAWNFGRPHPPETIAKITQRTKEAMMRPEVLKRVRENHPHKGHGLSEESRAKMRKSIAASHQRRREAKAAGLDAAAFSNAQGRAPRPRRRPKRAAVTAVTAENASIPAQREQDALDAGSQTTEVSTARPQAKGGPRQQAAAASAEALLQAAAESSGLDSDSPGRDADAVSQSHAESQSDSDSDSVGASTADGQPRKKQSRKRTEAHNRAIALAIKNKWTSPEYRDRILEGMRADGSQHQRISAYKMKVQKRNVAGREKLGEARARQEQLQEARRTVQALQTAVQAGQQQAEALRGDPEGFARQQELLNSAQQLVAHAQARVAAMEANTPSLEQVAAELGARPSVDHGPSLSPEEQADADEDVKLEQLGPDADVVAPPLHAITSRRWDAPIDGQDNFNATAARDVAYGSWQEQAGPRPEAKADLAVRDLQPV